MSTTPYRIIFAGTPDFSLPTLETLIKDERFTVVGVLTAPDKPVGRKQVLTPPPVKTAALNHGIPVLQPARVMDAYDAITALKPDCMVVIAYGHIIPQRLIDLPPHGIVNLHASLLPRWRGASPIQAAIAAGDTQTGVTLMKIDAGCDTGAILAQETYSIKGNETGASLHDALAQLSAEVARQYLQTYLTGSLEPQPQNDAQATSAKKLTRETGHIDWQQPAAAIERLVRAYHPWPGTWSQWNNKTLKIIAVEHEPIHINDHAPGTVFEHNDTLAVQCKNNALVLTTLQLQGKKPLDAASFLRGNAHILHSVLA